MNQAPRRPTMDAEEGSLGEPGMGSPAERHAEFSAALRLAMDALAKGLDPSAAVEGMRSGRQGRGSLAEIQWELELPKSRRAWDLAWIHLESGGPIHELDALCSNGARAMGVIELAVSRGQSDWARRVCQRGWAPWESSPSKIRVEMALEQAEELLLASAKESSSNDFQSALKSAACLEWLGLGIPWLAGSVQAMLARSAPGGQFEGKASLREAAHWAADVGQALRSPASSELELSCIERERKLAMKEGELPGDDAIWQACKERCQASWSGWGEGLGAPWAKAVAEAMERDAPDVLSCLLQGSAKAGLPPLMCRSSLGSAGTRRSMWTTLLGACFASWSWSCALELLEAGGQISGAGSVESASARACILFESALGAVGREADPHGRARQRGMPSQALARAAVAMARGFLDEGVERSICRGVVETALASAARRADSRWGGSSIGGQALALQSCALERAQLSLDAWFGAESQSQGAKRL